MKQVDIFKQKIFTGDKNKCWPARVIKMEQIYICFSDFFLNACISPSGYLSSDNSTSSYYFDATRNQEAWLCGTCQIKLGKI